MKKYLPMFIVSFVIIYLSGCANPVSVSNPPDISLTSQEKQLVSSTEIFGFKLFKQVNQTAEDSNIFISPLSVSTALGMTLNGANGKTYDEMKSTLELTGANQDDINKAYHSLNQMLTQIDPKVIFESANSIWYRQGVTFEKSFLDVNKDYFDATVQGLDFSNPSSAGIINDWVNEKTNGKIPSIIDHIPTEAVMYLINAIYFKGTWLYKFDSAATKQDDFYVTQNNPVKCMMMSQKDKFDYYQSSGYQAIELPYGNGDFSMLVILPSGGTNINSFINQIDESFWDNLINNMDSSEVNLWLPKFKLEYNIELSKTLEDMGMSSAFDPFQADFSKLRPQKDIDISRVLHKAYIKVDEEGTEAAAATAVEMSLTAVIGPSPIYMKVNHPFLFAIRENNSGAILFIGKVIDPVQ